MSLVNNSLFFTKIENFFPNSIEYKIQWREEAKRCIEGYWVAGKYIPPQLYFYINHWHITLNEKLSNGKYSIIKTVGKPFLRDIDWERGCIYLEAKGFSGFDLDDKYHCIREEFVEENLEFTTNKEYINARDYLRKNHGKNLGKPLYYNDAKNVFDLEARGGGKTVWSSCIIAHNYLFDGKIEFNNDKTLSQSLISGIKMDYVTNLAKQIKIGLDNLEGKQFINGKTYPPPFYKNGRGILSTELVASIETQKNGVKTTIGSGSRICARTFGSDIFAANGLRPNITVIDEVGFMHNIKEVLTALKDCTYFDSKKFGILWLTGTGGEMEGKAIHDVKDVFYNPDTWDMLEFEDIYENKGKMGFFVPKYYTINDFKDENGNTDLVKSKIHLELKFNKVLNSKDTVAINGFMLNSPLVPSHAFLTNEGSVYPTALIKEQIAKLESLEEYKNCGTKGFLEETSNGVIFNVNHKLKEVNYPVRQNESIEGCLVIYEEPNSSQDSNLKYIAGTDPYIHDGKGQSLGSTFIYKRNSLEDIGDILVAEYTGRPKTVKEYNEQTRLLCKYYNASLLYENQFQNIKEHFENKNSLSFLAKTPNTFKSTVTESRTYGLNRTTDIALELEQYSANWLEELNPLGNINLSHIKSINLLKELLVYDGKINTDRVIAFQLCIAYKIHLTRKTIFQKRKQEIDTFFKKKLCINY